MKKHCIIFLSSVIIILMAFIGFPKTEGAGTGVSLPTTEYLRIHVRANSNTEYDQQIKYEVRDAVVKALAPIVNACDSKAQARETLRQNLSFIESVADEVLEAQGYSYRSNATLRFENFPTRVYDSLTLPEGVYEALILELGSGKGDNWWCVVYPPLCFSGEGVVAGEIVYKSKIAELIAQFK